MLEPLLQVGHYFLPTLQAQKLSEQFPLLPGQVRITRGSKLTGRWERPQEAREPIHPPSFEIDHQGDRFFEQRTDRIRQVSNLTRRIHIPAEQNNPGRLNIFQELCVYTLENGPLHADPHQTARIHGII